MKVYSLKDSFLLQRRLSTVSNQPAQKIDDSIFDIIEMDVVKNSSKGRGNNLNTSKEYTGDFAKIENVHFVKGTGFDRDYFRRLYPNINVRIKPELADVIIYDEQALFSNDLPTRYALETTHNGKLEYIVNIISAFNNLVESIVSPMSWSARSYGPFDVEKNSLINSYIQNAKSSTQINKSCYLSPVNKYFEALRAADLPYIHVNEVFNNFPSDLKQNNLNISECITYLSQITSKDTEMAKTAMESVLMYNSKKYLPIQCLLCSIYNRECAGIKSNKINLFMGANRNYIINFSSVFELLSYFSRIFVPLKSNPYDWDLTREFATSVEFSQKVGGQFNFPHIRIHGINFEFDEKSPLYKVPQVEKTANISEFVL